MKAGGEMSPERLVWLATAAFVGVMCSVTLLLVVLTVYMFVASSYPELGWVGVVLTACFAAATLAMMALAGDARRDVE